MADPIKDLLNKPVPIVFAVCQGVQQLATGGLNLLGIFDRLTAYETPDGTRPNAVSLTVASIWPGGRGNFVQVMDLLDQDGNTVLRAEQPFDLASPSHRHVILSMVAFPVREGAITMVLKRGEEELLRQDFTIEVAPFPGQSSQ